VDPGLSNALWVNVDPRKFV